MDERNQQSVRVLAMEILIEVHRAAGPVLPPVTKVVIDPTLVKLNCHLHPLPRHIQEDL